MQIIFRSIFLFLSRWVFLAMQQHNQLLATLELLAMSSSPYIVLTPKEIAVCLNLQQI